MSARCPCATLCPDLNFVLVSLSVERVSTCQHCISPSLSPCFSLSLSLPLSLSHCHSPSVPTITRTDFLSPLPLSVLYPRSADCQTPPPSPLCWLLLACFPQCSRSFPFHCDRLDPLRLSRGAKIPIARTLVT